MLEVELWHDAGNSVSGSSVVAGGLVLFISCWVSDITSELV